jgi:hypothetical protein
MKIKRDWATPLTAGAFLLTAVTGVLMFFHLDTGINKTAHEWLSWILVFGVGMHLVPNFIGFKRYLASSKGKLLMGGFALLLALSFIPMGGSNEPPFVSPIKALSSAPLTTLAQVAQITPDQLAARMADAGITVKSYDQNVNELVGNDFRKQTRLLKEVLAQK